MRNYNLSFDMTGKVAIVTGVSGGLGVEFAYYLAKFGAEITICARRLEKLQQQADWIEEQTGKKPLVVQCDISDEEQVKNVVDKTLEKFGKIDILVNNAAIIHFGGAEDIPFEQVKQMLDIDVVGTWKFCRAVFNAYMKEHGGRIVNVNSIVSYSCSKEAPAYHVTKAAEAALTQNLSLCWAQYGVHVNGVAPGTHINGGMVEGTPQYLLDRIAEGVPQGRLGDFGDLAGAMLFLASDANTYCHGQTIICDGGMGLEYF